MILAQIIATAVVAGMYFWASANDKNDSYVFSVHVVLMAVGGWTLLKVIWQ